MSAAEALKVARSVGVRLAVDGDDLVLKGSASPPPPVFDFLRRHKAEIMLLLRPAGDGWSARLLARAPQRSKFLANIASPPARLASPRLHSA